MAIKRVTTWQTELHKYIQSRRGMPFAWASNDCSTFAADAVLAITGTDIADDFRSPYTDEASAFALIKSVTGGTTVADAAAHCAAKHGLPEYKHVLQAKRGDLVVIHNGGRLVAGVVNLDGRYVLSVGDKGIVPTAISKDTVIRAWAV